MSKKNLHYHKKKQNETNKTLKQWFQALIKKHLCMCVCMYVTAQSIHCFKGKHMMDMVLKKERHASYPINLAPSHLILLCSS